MSRRPLRVSLNLHEVGHVVGALRERIDGYQEQVEEEGPDEWIEAQLAVLVPLERRLTRRGGLMEKP